MNSAANVIPKVGSGLSLGIVQAAPTQFDEPFYRYFAKQTGVQLVVYYYGASESSTRRDPEIGRQVGWNTFADRGYAAVFADGTTPFKFARQVIHGAHHLVIISGYNHKHALITAMMAKVKRLPTGLRSDNVLPESGGRGRHWRIKAVVYPLLSKLFAAGHPVGRQAAEYLARFGFEKDALFRFPYAIDHQWFARESAYARADRSRYRTLWGLPAVGQVICGVTKFSEREDPLTLVRAFRTAKKQLPDLTLLLVGDGPIRKKVEEAAGSELGKSVILPGYQNYDRLPSVYAVSDLFVHTASGAWEVSVNEALACGLPVVTSDRVGSAKEIVIPAKLGYTFEHGNVDDLACRIVDVIQDAQLLCRVRGEAPAALEEWDYPATAQRLIAAIRFASGTQGL